MKYKQVSTKDVWKSVLSDEDMSNMYVKISDRMMPYNAISKDDELHTFVVDSEYIEWYKRCED